MESKTGKFGNMDIWNISHFYSEGVGNLRNTGGESE